MPPARRAAPVDWRLTPSPERPPRNGPPGDAAPDLAPGDTAFLVMVGFFLLAQVTYIAGSGQSNKNEILRFGETILSTNPFSASAGSAWALAGNPCPTARHVTNMSSRSSRNWRQYSIA